MAKRNRKRMKGGRGDVRAPGDTQLGRTASWTLTDIIPIWAQGTYGALSQQTIRFQCGLNGYNYGIFAQNGTAQLYNHGMYTDNTGMFNRLANLYTQYRVVSVSYEWHGATMAGPRGFYHAPAVSWTNPEGSSTTLPISIEEFARSPSGTMESFPQFTVTRSHNYIKWLTENLDHPYLLTIDQSAQRELYAENNIPALAFWKIITPTESFTTNMVFGFMRIRVHYEFRGARVNTSALLLKNVPQQVFSKPTAQSLTGQEEEEVYLGGERVSGYDVITQPRSAKAVLTQSAIGQISEIVTASLIRK